MGERIRAHPWASTPLGPPESWPQSLRTAIRLILNTGHPMYIFWGPEGLCFYNDAYRHSIGPERHPGSLGQPARAVWDEIWPVIGPQIEQVMSGGRPTWHVNQRVPITRNGQLEEVYWTYSYGPIDDETAPNGIGGVLVVCSETTEQVLAEQRLSAERERQRMSLRQMPGFVALLSGPEHRYDYVNDAYREIAGERDFIGRTVRDVFPELSGQGFFELLDEVYASGNPYTAASLPVSLERPDGQRYIDLLYAPIRDDDGSVTGIFVGGYDITDHVRALERLRLNEAELQVALKAARLGTWTLDLASGDMATSAACRTNFGRPADAPFPYAELRDAVHPDDRARMGAAVERSVATGEDYDIDYRIVTPAGETRWVQIRAQPIAGQDGVITTMTGVSLDITDRMRTERRLAESESRYRSLFEAMDAGFCVLELKFDETGRAIDYRHIETNPAFERQTGLRDYVGVWVRDALPGLERHWFDIYGEVALTGRQARFEDRAEPLGRWFDVHAFRIGAPEDRNVAVLFNDITGRRQAEDRLRTLNDTLEAQVIDRTAELRQFRDIVEATASPICAFDADFRLIAFNKAHNDEFRRVNGFDTKLGDVFPDLFIADQQPVMRALMTRALSGERFTVIEEFGRPELGQPCWEISYTPLRNAKGAVIGAFHLANDISDRLRAEADLAAAQEALRQSQKMEAMGSLTGGVAHDFNNLLTPIVGSLDLLQRKGFGGERERRLIDGAVQSAERAKTLVQRLLAFARRQPLQPEAVDVAALVRGMADLIASTSGPRVRLEIDMAVDLPPAQADANQVEMALLNLAVNARDAMPDGGRLSIAAAAERIDGDHRGKVAPGDYVRLSVADTGGGMDEATLGRATEPFFSTKGVGKGTGLGLSMVHGLAAQLGGGLAIGSTPGLGTTVELWLPASRDPVRSANPPPSEERAAMFGTALLVDDEPLVRASTGDMLMELGYRVVEAASAEDAMKLIADGLAPDILVTDHLMPAMTGTDLVRRLRDNRNEVPALIVSGYAEAEGIAPDLPRLVKPFRQVDLATAIGQLTRAEGR